MDDKNRLIRTTANKGFVKVALSENQDSLWLN